jgi:hypothetical protein
MIDQQLDLAVHPLTWLGPRQVRLAQRRPRDRERVDRVRLPARPTGSAFPHRQLRRDPHQILTAAKQLPLQPGRQEPAVLDRPQPLRIERCRSRSTVSVGGGDTTLESQTIHGTTFGIESAAADRVCATHRTQPPTENDIEFRNDA